MLQAQHQVLGVVAALAEMEELELMVFLEKMDNMYGALPIN